MDYGKGNRKEEEMKRWEDSDSSCSSDSSEGHIILGKNIPRPTTTCMSAAQGGKKKKKKEPAAATICSAPCLSSSSQINQLIGMPGYDPNRIPASVFSGRPSNPMDWSLASNDSLFSIHMGNFSFSGDQALAALARSGEKQKSSSNPVPPSVRDPDTFEEMKPELTDKNMKQGEVSDDEGGGDEEIREEEGDEVIEPGSDDGSEISAETNRQEDEEGDDDEQQMQEQGGENEIVEEEDDDEVNEKKPTNPSDVTHSTSISCRSDTSNNSNCSFAFPVMESENGVKTPYTQTHVNGSKKTRPQKEFSQSPLQHQHQQTQTQTQSLHPQSQTPELPEAEPHGKQRSKEGKTQPLKSPIFRWFSCFYFPLRCC